MLLTLWNSNDRMVIEKVFAQILEEFKINRQSYRAYYIMSALVDRSTYFK